MIAVEPKIFFLAEPSMNLGTPDDPGVIQWLEHIGGEEARNCLEIYGGHLEGADIEQLIELLARRCFDAETDILTNSGWKRFASLKVDDAVATLNKETHALQFQVPLAIWSYDYQGIMKCVESRDVSFCVTPEHRQYVSVRRSKDGSTDYDPYCFWTTESLKSKEFKVKTAARWDAGIVPLHVVIPSVISSQLNRDQSEREITCEGLLVQDRASIKALAKLLVYYATEGTSEVGKGGFYVYGDHLPGVQACCDVLGLSCSYTTDNRSGVKRIRVGGGLAICAYVIENCGYRSPDKTLPEWVCSLPPDWLEEVWDLLIETDGSDSNGRRRLTTCSSSMIDRAQEILAKLGKSSSVVDSGEPTNYPTYAVCEKLGRDACLNGIGATRLFDVPYEGKVFCVTTENGVVLTRRHGRVHYSGNCYKSYAPGLNPNVTKIRTNSDEYHANIQKSRHGSVVANGGMVTYAFEDVSRVFSHEIVRNWVGNERSQESLRYVRLTDIRFWIPPIIAKETATKMLIMPPDLMYTDGILPGEDVPWDTTPTMIFQHVVQTCEWAQKALAKYYDIDNIKDFELKKKLTSAFRRVAPIGLATGIGMSFNLRSLRWVLEQRTSRHAEEEIRLVFGMVAEDAMKRWPKVFQDVTKVDTGDGLFEYVPAHSKI